MGLILNRHIRDSSLFRALSNSRLKWIAVALLIVLIDLTINLVLLALRPSMFLQIPPEPVNLALSSVSARAPTSTPYQPLSPTSTVLAPMVSASLEVVASPATSTPNPEPSHDFYSIDFHPGAASIKLLLYPPTAQVNHGQAIAITVNPSRNCPYEEGRACVRAFRTAAGGNVIFVSVHSGVDGEAEAYRRAIEGLGLNQAGFALRRIRNNMASLASAAVQIKQEERLVEGLQLAAAGRVPPRLIQDYFHNPVEQALAIAATANPELKDFVNPTGTILVFETCGWTVPGEAWAPGVTSVSSSVYIGVIQLAP